MIVSEHFREAWARRVGLPVPDGDQLRAMVLKSVRVTYQCPGCRGCKESRAIAAYWIPSNGKKSIVVKVDEDKDVAVTVLSEDLAGTWIRKTTGFNPPRRAA